MIFLIFIRAWNFFRNSVDWTTSPGLPLKLGTKMGANIMEGFGKAVVDEKGNGAVMFAEM